MSISVVPRIRSGLRWRSGASDRRWELYGSGWRRWPGGRIEGRSRLVDRARDGQADGLVLDGRHDGIRRRGGGGHHSRLGLDAAVLDVSELGKRLRRRMFEVGAIAGEPAEVHEARGVVERPDVAFRQLDVMDLETVVDDGLDESLLDGTDGTQMVAMEL